MSLVVVRKMSKQIVRGNQLQDGVTKKFQRLIVATVQQQTQLINSQSINLILLPQAAPSTMHILRDKRQNYENSICSKNSKM